jgi:hypothetical protein
MKRIVPVLAMASALTLGCLTASTPAYALETYEAQMQASDAASQARIDMIDAFGPKILKPGQYLWRDLPNGGGPQRVVISLSDQMAYLYRGDELMAATTISTGRDEKPTPTGIFSVFNKTPFYRSKKYDNAAMPFAQFFDPSGIALHAGYVGNVPNSHGCVHLPTAFAKKLYGETPVGTPIYIGA